MSRRTERRKKQNISKRQLSVAQKLKLESDSFFNQKYKHSLTRESYKNNYKKFIDYCRKFFRCTTKEECEQHIQDYSDWLQSQGKSASTIHTYLAPICCYFKISMSEIDKPIRHVSENKRSRERENKYKRTDQQYDNPKYSDVAEFASKVGVRRNELLKLNHDNLKLDESGYWCVEVKKGKGGKYQLQRILPDDVEFVKEYFDKAKGHERLFKSTDFSSNMDYHHLRALQAQRAYRYYYDLTHNPDGSENKDAAYKLRGEITKRWNAYNLTGSGKSRHLDMGRLKGTYRLRGKNRVFALEHGLPLEYDRMCVMAVSIFHLSHWRLDTLTNYLLAV